MRVVVDGAAGSPLPLGVLQLDRSPPDALQPAVTAAPDGSTVVASWIQQDTWAGTDLGRDVQVEINASAAGDAAGAWIPFSGGTGPAGDGPRTVVTNASALPDGPHLVRVVSADLAGNAGARVLGAAVLDRRPPAVTELRLVRPPTGDEPTAEIAYTVADPAPGLGIDPATQAVAGGATGVPTFGAAPVGQPIRLTFPAPGMHTVTVTVVDRAGLVGRSAPLDVLVPVSTRPDPAERIAFLVPAKATRPPARGVLDAYAAVRRLAARRNVRLTARVASSDGPAAWKRLLRSDRARTIEGYATLAGRILIGPRATRALEDLRRARARMARRPAALPSRLDVDRMVFGLAVLLHEAVHATGPAARDDFRDRRSGRVLEEGLTEAVTIDLLPRLVRQLGVPRRLERELLDAAARYSPVYSSAVAWVHALSARATDSRASSAAAVRWRLGVADRWGADRWQRLARALDTTEAELRAAAPELYDDEGRR